MHAQAPAVDGYSATAGKAAEADATAKSTRQVLEPVGKLALGVAIPIVKQVLAGASLNDFWISFAQFAVL